MGSTASPSRPRGTIDVTHAVDDRPLSGHDERQPEDVQTVVDVGESRGHQLQTTRRPERIRASPSTATVMSRTRRQTSTTGTNRPDDGIEPHAPPVDRGGGPVDEPVRRLCIREQLPRG
jgi:hypothetical protein